MVENLPPREWNFSSLDVCVGAKEVKKKPKKLLWMLLKQQKLGWEPNLALGPLRAHL